MITTPIQTAFDIIVVGAEPAGSNLTKVRKRFSPITAHFVSSSSLCGNRT